MSARWMCAISLWLLLDEFFNLDITACIIRKAAEKNTEIKACFCLKYFAFYCHFTSYFCATEILVTLYCSSTQERNSLWRKSSRRVKSPMLVALPHLSVSHGYLSCTNTDDGLHTHRSMATLFTHLSDKRCLYLVPYDIQRIGPNCGPSCENLHRKRVRHYSTAYIFFKCGLWILHTSLSVMFVYGKHESIVLQLTSLKTSHSKVKKNYLFCVV
jgi:hypothetical protein